MLKASVLAMRALLAIRLKLARVSARLGGVVSDDAGIARIASNASIAMYACLARIASAAALCLLATVAS